MATSVQQKVDYVILCAKQPSCICGMNSRGCSTQDGLQHNRILHWYREFKEVGVCIIRVLEGRPQASRFVSSLQSASEEGHWNCCDGYCVRCRYHTAPVGVLAAVSRHVLNWMTSCTHIVQTLHLCFAYQIMHFVVCWIVIVKFVSVLLPAALN